MTFGRSDSVAHPFDVDTRVIPIGAARFSAHISGRWNTFGGRAFGGYGLAVCLRALDEVLPSADPLVLSAFFLSAVRPGPAEVSTEVVRVGRRTATGEARLSQENRERLRMVATFADLRTVPKYTALFGAPPKLPRPERCVDLVESTVGPRISVSQRVECRAPAASGWRAGAPTGRPCAEFWMRFREPRDPDLSSLALLVDAAAPAVFELGAAGSTTLELTVHLRAHPTPGWLACRAQTRYVIGGYHEEDFEIWDSDAKLVAQSRQLALLHRMERALE
jgi:acyl-CoA thioesterase